jgi:hypothetical protein
MTSQLWSNWLSSVTVGEVFSRILARVAAGAVPKTVIASIPAAGIVVDPYTIWESPAIGPVP